MNRSHWMRKWEAADLGQGLFLLGIYLLLLVMMMNRHENNLAPWGIALGLVMGTVGAVAWLWKLWDRGKRSCAVKRFMRTPERQTRVPLPE
jgi:hypothetical protein